MIIALALGIARGQMPVVTTTAFPLLSTNVTYSYTVGQWTSIAGPYPYPPQPVALPIPPDHVQWVCHTNVSTNFSIQLIGGHAA